MLEIKIICQTKTVYIDIFFLIKLTGVTSWLLQFDEKKICSNNFSNIDCKVSDLKKQIVACKGGQSALIS